MTDDINLGLESLLVVKIEDMPECKHKQYVREDPQILVGNDFYSNCYDCFDYKNCRYYESSDNASYTNK